MTPEDVIIALLVLFLAAPPVAVLWAAYTDRRDRRHRLAPVAYVTPVIRITCDASDARAKVDALGDQLARLRRRRRRETGGRW